MTHTPQAITGNHRRSFLAGTVFSASGMGVSALVTMLTGAIFARWLRPEGFGLYSLVVAVATFGAGIGAAGMDYTVSRYVSFYLGSGERQLIRTVIRYALGWGVTFSLAAGTAVFALLRSGRLAGTRLANLAPFALPILFLIPTLAAQGVLLQAILAMQAVRLRVALEKMVLPWLRLLLPFALLLCFRDRAAAVAGFGASSLLLIAAAALALRGRLHDLPAGASAPAAARAEWRGYAVPYVFFSLQNFVSAGMGIDMLLVSALGSVRDSGIYAACFRFTLALTLARAGMDYAFGPKVGRLFGQLELGSIRDLYRTSSAIGLAWTLPLAVIFICFSLPLMATVFGAPYARGGPALAVLVIGFAVDGAAGCCNTLLAMIGKPWLVFANGLVGGVFTVVLCLLLIPSFGMVGAAAAVSVARCASTAMGIFEIWRLHGFHPFGPASSKLLLAGASIAILGCLFWRYSGPASTQSILQLGLSAGLILTTYALALRVARFSIHLG